MMGGMAKRTVEVTVKDMAWGRWAAERILELEAEVARLKVDCWNSAAGELDAKGRPEAARIARLMAEEARRDATTVEHADTHDGGNIHCPECGSRNVECVEKPHHNHICHDCGHTLLPSTGDGDA
jgi:Zn finger protein HypA/HybF involved in hydrogenase expression